MRRRFSIFAALLCCLLPLRPAAAGDAPGAPAPVPDEARLRAMSARFAPVDIGADVAALPEGERRALAKTIEAARDHRRDLPAPGVGGERAAAAQLLDDRSPLGQARLHAFLLDKGPWSRLDHDAPFVPGVPGQAGGRQLLPGRRDAGPRSRRG